MACIQAWPSKPRNLHRRASDSGARSATAASGCNWAHCSTCIRLRRYRPSIFLPAMAAFTPFPRTPQAARSHLGLGLSWVRRGRAGAGAGQDCTELAAELVEPLVLFLESLSAPPAFGYSRCSIAYRCTFSSTVGCQFAVLWPPPRRQLCKEFLLAAVGRRKRLPGSRHGCN
jgi:hypothetical protein